MFPRKRWLLLPRAGLLLQWLLSLGSVDSRRGLQQSQHVGSSQTRNRTCVPCTGKRVLNHKTTREVLEEGFFDLPLRRRSCLLAPARSASASQCIPTAPTAAVLFPALVLGN
ncbi:unnamed protein product [Rangifer tarandus platyrhynchus]|uniref:Uncharacterized protein n=1 Tax=Rangifer tarandus platyrhynchus TaxID=3082113 RepID=A0AC60A9G5_RANTA